MSEQEGFSPPPFKELQWIECNSILPPDGCLENVKKTWARGIPCLSTIPGYRNTQTQPVAMVAGGPSVDDFVDKIKTFQTITVCGSAHDHLIADLGIIPTYSVITDPQACHVDFLKHKHPDVTYLVDSRVDHAIFDHLEGHKVYHWNARHEGNDELFADKHSFGWGAFASIKAISLMVCLGYWNQHFFGLDACCKGSMSHAYDYDDARPFCQVTIENGPTLTSAPDLVAMAQQFFRYWECIAQYFRPTIYGDGLIVQMLKHGAAGDLPAEAFLGSQSR